MYGKSPPKIALEMLQKKPDQYDILQLSRRQHLWAVRSINYIYYTKVDLKGTETFHLNGLKVVWSDRSRLGGVQPAIHYSLNFPFDIILNL